MTQSLEELRITLHKRLNDLRAIERLTYSDKFIELFESNKDELVEAVLSLNRVKLDILLSLSTNLSSTPTMSLREICRNKGIRNWWSLTRKQMLESLYENPSSSIQETSETDS
jgi:hypothetical protein